MPKTYYFKTITSTNDQAIDLVKQGTLTSGDAVWAGAQTKGKGTRGRDWISLPGNLFASFILPPAHNTPHLGSLSFISALALGNLLDTLSLPYHYKWPNDILIKGRKLSGTLIELCQHNNQIIPVVGIGLNVIHAPYEQSTCLQSIMDEKKCPHLSDVFSHVYKQLHHFYTLSQTQGFDFIKKKWIKKCTGLGKFVIVKTTQAHYRGVFSDIDDCGNMIICDDNHKFHCIRTGEVFLSNTG